MSDKKLGTTVLTVVWIMCFIFNRGFMLGGMTMDFPQYRHDVAGTGFALGGPFTLPIGIYLAASGAPYMIHGRSCQQRWDAWDSQTLGLDWFVHRDGNWDCENFTPEKGR